MCPVLEIKLYINYLSSSIDDLWQRPNQRYEATGVWYNAQPLGVHKLNNMMRNMSVAAGLPLRHTNHCVRDTAATIMSEVGIQDRDIIHVTGHKELIKLNINLSQII